jgi:hypothetical protein
MNLSESDLGYKVASKLAATAAIVIHACGGPRRFKTNESPDSSLSEDLCSLLFNLLIANLREAGKEDHRH